MVIKKCCVPKCKSKSTRKEDARVTYHKFPKDVSVRDAWVQVTRHPHSDVELNKYVCSRHFLLTDFEHYQGRYVLKSGAVPTVFAWKTMDELDSLTTIEDPGTDKRNLSTSSKESEPENLEAIKNFIAKHNNNVSNNGKDDQSEAEKSNDRTMEMEENTTDSSVPSNKEEPLAIASSVMDLIFNESADKIPKEVETAAQNSPQNDKSTVSVALSVGSKVEARDFGENWYAAEIMEVDYDEMEVLVRFDSVTKKPEEWISVNSPRLRPVNAEIKSAEVKSTESSSDEMNMKVKQTKVITTETVQPAKEEKVENKSKVIFTVGERCLARWRDNRRFVATIQNVLGDGKYEILFDDGFQWKCGVSRLSKLKDSSKTDSPFDSRVCSTPSPTPGAGPSTSSSPITIPVYHKHLFDPTRDYLGSKSERREQKRKLNIKEIFNIGQKQRRKEMPVKEEKQKNPKENKLRVKKKVMVEIKSEVKLEKNDIPDAIASIIGTVTNDDIKEEALEGNVQIKEELTQCKDELEVATSKELKPKEEENEEDYKNIDANKLKKESNIVVSDNDMEEFDSFVDQDIDLSSDQDTKLSDDPDEKMTLDKIQEEDKLQNFEKPDDAKHVEVMDRIKEAINKLEDGLNRELKADSPKVNIQLNVDLPKVVKLEVDVDSPINSKVNDDLNKISGQVDDDSSKINKPVDDDSFKVNKIDIDLPEENREVDVKSPKMIDELKDKVKDDLPTINKGVNIVSPKVEVDQNPEKPTEKIKIKLEPSSSKLKKSKKGSKYLLKLAQRIKVLGEEQKAGAIVEISTKLENIKKEMKEILMMFEKEVPQSSPVEGEWCCKWVDGEPVGNVVDTEPDNRVDVLNRIALPRKTVQVEDKRLPEGWSKLMVRRSLGHSAGKWDVVLVSPDKRRFHTKTDMRHYLESNPDPSLKAYEHALLDFAIHLKLARRMGWVTGDSGHASRSLLNRPLPIKRKKMMMKRDAKERKVKKRKLSDGRYKFDRSSVPGTSDSSLLDSSGNISFNNTTLEEGYVYVGSLKVQVIDNLLRCPADGCFKNFRNNTLLQMHIKHYHRELRKSLGATPKVLDLAYARTMPTETETRPDNKIIKVKIPRPPKRIEEKLDTKEVKVEPQGDSLSPMPVKIPKSETERIPRSLDSPIMRQIALQANRPVKRPRVLLPVRRPEPVEPPPELEPMEDLPDMSLDNSQLEPKITVPPLQILDFETAISTHTVSKPLEIRKRPEKRKVFATISKAPLSEDEDVTGMNSDLETRSSFPGSGTPDSKTMEPRSVVQNIPMSSESNEDTAMYMYTETGERIKLERMKREEIINCHCGFREEDGLMVQCELCLCWQHALCHNIQREADVPQKYTCSICLSPRRGRRSQRYLHDQDRMKEGLLPGAPPSEPLHRSHDISGNLLHIADALQALRVKYYVATKKNHPKLYLWAKDWDGPEAAFAQDRPNAYSDLSVIINNLNSNAGKQTNMRPRSEEPSRVDMHTPTEDQEDRFSQNGSLSNHSLLGGLLSSPGGPSLEMPISTSELERLAKSVQEQAVVPTVAATAGPQPEAAIENGACRERLLRHVQRCQALIDARLDTLEAEIIELEAQDPSFEDDETADYFPRTKQTVMMLMRDLHALQQLGMIT